MTSFVHTDFPTHHAGIARVEAAIESARELRKGFNGTKGLAAMLLAAVVSALLVVADQVIVTWADGQLLAAWIALWAIGFAALALFAGSARRVACRVVAALDAWSHRVAQARADERLWDIALTDPRIMSDLQAAMTRHAAETSDVAAAPVASFEPYTSPRIPSLDSRKGRAHLSYFL
ncbi:MAG TPA: hypothetical protein VLJ57_14225 [Burkholderiaceae bacterium]|nr:hypothetical protein [Burkholderiaceae bacterium]